MFCGVITINVKGYGELTSKDGQGEPILIEKFENKLRVVLWGDINAEEATHIVDMEGAREDWRNENTQRIRK